MSPGKITDRFLAYLIDTLPFGIGYYASLLWLVVRVQALAGTPQTYRLAFLAWLCAYLLYHAAGNAAGCTVGKWIMGLRVVDLDGRPLGIGKAVLRALGLLISTPLFNLGFLWAFADPRSRTWHDLLAGSRVVEAYPASSRRSSGRAALAFLALGAILAATVWFYLVRRTPRDLAAVERAREGLKVLAQIEERFKAKNGTYTGRLSELAEASGDAEEFRRAMREIFDPDRFRIRAGKNRYVLSARAKDRRRTAVTLAGP